jgi:hypothetical protein
MKQMIIVVGGRWLARLFDGLRDPKRYSLDLVLSGHSTNGGSTSNIERNKKEIGQALGTGS